MKVTDLRVVGFKSFVDQISMKIEPGLTGIVGPNGCGKSNILESLRWVMGATSARALRGGEMDDVIFAGTDKRPARDIAEVTIVLDNSDGLAPVPFQEAPVLEVSRRIRRAAGSSFRINGKEVRARDVQLLFADASTGANSPALVRQNQVSELINAKPENRRRILEEAAGIAGLYTRRHEAELKLRGAQTNLERLDDVILNMNDTLATLKRQARQALKYRTIADDIRALEAFLFAKRLQESEQANTLAIAALKEAEKALADATLADNQASRAADQSDDVLNPLRQEQAIAEAILRRLEGQKFAADRETKAAEEALASAQSDLARIAKDEERETLLRDDAHQTLANLAEEKAKLPPDDGDTRGVEEALSRLKTLEAARETAELALTQLTTQRAEAAAERNAQIRACEDAKSQMRRRMDAVARAEEELKRLQANLPQASALEAARNQATQVADTAAQAAERADQCEKDAELAAIKEAEARETSRRAQNDLDLAVSEQKALQATTHQPKAGTWPKALDHIKPAAGYERALAAAFGDELDAALDPAAPIAWTMAEARQFTWPQAITPLTEFVTTAPPALLARLAAIGLVGETDFDAVTDLPTGARIVTRSGNMRRWDGYVRRKDAVANSAAILEQRARLAELEAHIVPLQTQAQIMAKAASDARSGADQARALARTARADAPRAFVALSAARDQVMRLEAEQARAQAGLDQANANCEAAKLELVQAQSLVQVTTELLASLPEVGQADALESAHSAAVEARAQAAQAQGNLSQVRAAAQARAERRLALERDLKSWESRQNQATARLAVLAEETKQAQARKAQASATPGEIEKRRAELLAQAPAAEARKAAADDALAKAESAIRSAREKARLTQNALADCREQRAAAATRCEAAATRVQELSDEIRRSLQIDPEDCEAKAKSKLGATYDTLSPKDGENRLSKLLYDRDALGGVNLRAEEEVVEQEARLNALVTDKDDLTAAIGKLRGGVDQINAEGKERLVAAFDIVHGHFRVLFEALFDGGTAELRLTESDDPLGGGLEVYACPPGKKLQSLTLMSGGEQALTASALIFAVFLSNPAPICVLDEVDAPLDDSNVDRYCKLLNEMRERTQTRFIVITHHPITMARMDRLFGVTMAERGVSQLVSVDLNRAEELIAAS